jgi:hypothetical protein
MAEIRCSVNMLRLTLTARQPRLNRFATSRPEDVMITARQVAAVLDGFTCHGVTPRMPHRPRWPERRGWP